MSTPTRAHEKVLAGSDGRRPVPRVLFVASEIYPLAKTGGLADVSSALPQVFPDLGIDVRLMLPAYPEALDRLASPDAGFALGEVLPGLDVRLIQGRLPGSELTVWLVDCPALYRRAGSLYQDPDGRDWDDNALRFALLNHVAARTALGQTPLGWKADIVHAHDWHTGLVPLLLGDGEDRPHSIFTIHNMAFQGLFPMDASDGLGLPEGILTPDCAEFYGHLSYLKAGIVGADVVTTVSPTYACEIRTPEFGFGLEGVLQLRGEGLVGIMNGIDTRLWNPSTDGFLARHYSASDMSGKAVCKEQLQRQLGLPVDPGAPLAVSLSRLTHQKMADVLMQSLPAMLTRHPRLQVAVHGCGEPALEQGLAALAGEFPDRLVVRVGYQEELEHRMHAGADILLHGSRFEPCGLAQLYAMHYGTIPIVRHVGGLVDSVIDAGEPPHRHIGSTGFVFRDASGEAMLSALDRCLETYFAWPDIWSDMRKLAMTADFSWARSSHQYADLYASLAPRRDRPVMPRAETDARRTSRMAVVRQGMNIVACSQSMSHASPGEGRRANGSSRGGRS